MYHFYVHFSLSLYIFFKFLTTNEGSVLRLAQPVESTLLSARRVHSHRYPSVVLPWGLRHHGGRGLCDADAERGTEAASVSHRHAAEQGMWKSFDQGQATTEECTIVHTYTSRERERTKKE